MNGATILICFILGFLGFFSMVGSLMSLSQGYNESHSTVETKWFKWQAPVRLVFGLLCFAVIIGANELSVSEATDNRISKLEEKFTLLEREVAVIKVNGAQIDTVRIPTQFYIAVGTAVSFNGGKILLSAKSRELVVSGGIFVEEKTHNDLYTSKMVETGDQVFMRSDTSLWRINILESNHSSGDLRLEVYPMN
ncbi:MAG: hypothetical protein WDO15_24510 [Bacteroidota bacterium]